MHTMHEISQFASFAMRSLKCMIIIIAVTNEILTLERNNFDWNNVSTFHKRHSFALNLSSNKMDCRFFDWRIASICTDSGKPFTKIENLFIPCSEIIFNYAVWAIRYNDRSLA